MVLRSLSDMFSNLPGSRYPKQTYFIGSSVRDRVTHRLMQLFVARKTRLRGLAGGKCSPESNRPRFRESLRNCGVGDQQVKAVIRAWNYVEFRGNSGIDQAAGVFHIFIHKQIESADADECGRQSGEIFDARRNRAGRNRGRAGRDAEQRSPGETIRARVPKELSHIRRNLASAAGSIVERRINQQLKEDGNFAAIASGNGE